MSKESAPNKKPMVAPDNLRGKIKLKGYTGLPCFDVRRGQTDEVNNH